MKQEKIEELKKELKEKVSEYMERKNCTLQYILSKDDIITDVIYANLYGHLILSVNPESFEITKVAKDVSVLDDDLFSRMNDGKNIEYISDDTHEFLWYTIETYFTEFDMSELDVKNKMSMLRYLKYCKENNITDFYLDKKYDDDHADLIDFYDNAHDYYKLGEFTVTMSRDVFDRRNERTYITFALGFDLLHKMLMKYLHGNPSIIFDFCYILADKFINSDYYNDNTKIMYDRLSNFVKDNKEEIQKSYLDFLGTTVSPLVCEEEFLKR